MFEAPSRDTNSPAYVPPAGYQPPANAGPQYPSAPSTPPRRRANWLVVSIVVGFVALASAVGVAGALAAEPAGQSSRVDAVPSAPAPLPVEPADEPASDLYYTPAATDFDLSIRITSKKCFGSAGCNVVFKVEAGWAMTLDPSTTWELTYEVTGVEDGPLIDTIEITGDQYSVDEQVVGTPRKATKLKIRPTDINKVGL